MVTNGGRRRKPHPAANARAWTLAGAAVAGVGLTVVFAVERPATASTNSSGATVTSTSSEDTTTTTAPVTRRRRLPGQQTTPQPVPTPQQPTQRQPRSRSGGS